MKSKVEVDYGVPCGDNVGNIKIHSHLALCHCIKVQNIHHPLNIYLYNMVGKQLGRKKIQF